MTGEVTETIADFTISAVFEELPLSVVERAKLHLLDTLGLMISGSVSEAGVIAREYADHVGKDGPSLVFGLTRRLSARFAAFANAAAAHAYNYDDTTPQISSHRTGGIHASGAVLPVVMALAEQTNASGQEMLIAYLIGVEVASRLNHAIDARHYANGFHTTGTLNVFGATCAAARLHNLNREHIITAIGIAASRAAGVRRNFGSMTEIMHTAHAAEDGLCVCDLATRGLTSASDALEGASGYFAAAAGGFAASEIAGCLGNPWVFENPGVWIKPYPNGALTHPGADCLLTLLEDNKITPDTIERIEVQTNERVWRTLQHHDPQDGAQARFSMEFILAMIALHRRAGLAEFTAEVLRGDETRAMMGRIFYTSYHKALDGYTNVTTFIKVTKTDGQLFRGRADYAGGSTESPMSFTEVAQKFRKCAAYGGLDSGRVEAVIEWVSAFESLGSLSELSPLIESV